MNLLRIDELSQPTPRILPKKVSERIKAWKRWLIARLSRRKDYVTRNELELAIIDLEQRGCMEIRPMPPLQFTDVLIKTALRYRKIAKI